MDSGKRDAVVLTGATGFLGRELLWKLMTELPVEREIVCLIRGESRRDSGVPARRSAQPAGARPRR